MANLTSSSSGQRFSLLLDKTIFQRKKANKAQSIKTQKVLLYRSLLQRNLLTSSPENI